MLTPVVLAAGPVGDIVGCALLANVFPGRAFIHPRRGMVGIGTPAGVGVEDVQTITYPDGVFP